MSNIIRLEPPIPLTTPKGSGYAHFLVNEGMENHFYWIVFLDDTGEIWTFPNPQVRADKNFTMERYLGDPQLLEIKKNWNKPKS